MTLSDAIEQVRKLVEARAKGTNGPWIISARRPPRGWYVMRDDKKMVICDTVSGSDDESADASFIAAAGSTDFAAILAELTKLSTDLDTANETIARLRKAMDAAQLAMRARYQEVCSRIAVDHWSAYKHGNSPRRADPHTEGASAGAEECSTAIAKLDPQ